eukprot:SAG22_NODE_8048_length_687_cov_1.656463_2_plen_36_part_01
MEMGQGPTAVGGGSAGMMPGPGSTDGVESTVKGGRR